MIQAAKKSLENIPFFLFTSPLFVVVHIEKEFHHLIEYRFVYREVVTLFIVPFAILALCYIIIRKPRKALLSSFVLMIPYYFFCDLKDGLVQMTGNAFITRYVFILPVTIFATLFFLYRIRRSGSSFRKTFLFANTVFICFIISDLLNMWLADGSKKNVADGAAIISSQYRNCKECVKPDIYHFIFDSYTSSAVLRSEFGFDNQPLDSFLSGKGFYLIPNSTSNYNLTPFSMASCFSFDYMKNLDTHQDFFMKEYFPGVMAANNNPLIPILEKEGYEIINYSIFDFKDHPPRMLPFDVWDLYLLYERHHIYKKIDADIGWNFRIKFGPVPTSERSVKYASQRDDGVKRIYAALSKTIAAKSTQPRFVYSHFMLPHPPYSLDSAGNNINIPVVPLSAEEDKKRYVYQLMYANKLIAGLVQDILYHSKRPCVIILQGDHGYKYFDKNKKELEFSNLNAIYFSNRNYQFLKKDASMVNTYRMVLNTFFAQHFPMLRDTSYFLQYK